MRSKVAGHCTRQDLLCAPIITRKTKSVQIRDVLSNRVGNFPLSVDWNTPTQVIARDSSELLVGFTGKRLLLCSTLTEGQTYDRVIVVCLGLTSP